MLGQLGLLAEAVDPPLALCRYDEAIAAMREAGDPVYAATWMGMRSRTELLHGNPARARRDLQASLGWLDRAGDERIRWYLGLVLAAEAAARGDDEPVARFLSDHSPRNDKERLTAEVVTVLADGLRAAESDEPSRREACLARALELAAVRRYHEVHTLASWAVTRLEESKHWWRVDSDGTWHTPPGEGRQSVRGNANQRVLTHLAVLRQDEPGAHASTEDLAEAGWPGERLVAKSAGNRVRVALSTLRGSGLTALIERGSHGWRLSPDHPVRRVRRVRRIRRVDT